MYSTQNAANMLRANVEQLDEVEAEVVKIMNSTMDVASELLDRMKGRSDNIDDTVNDLKELLAGHVGIENDVRRLKTCLNDIGTQLPSVQDIAAVDLDEALKASYERSPNPTNVEDHERYKELIRLLDNVAAASDEDGGVVAQAQASSADESADLILTERENSVPIDPLTKKPVEDPVRNSICKHVYERATILAHITRRRGNCRCPVAACSNDRPFSQDMLEEHDELRRQIRRNKATQNSLCI